MAVSGREVIAQYRDPGARARAYLNLRWMVCPFDRVLPLVPTEGRLLDVGCGSGLWLSYLALERPRLELHGVDPDARKLALAARSSSSLSLLQQPVEEVTPGSFDCVTILDVLCLLSNELKTKMLAASYRALRPGGTIVVKDADTRPWWKYAPMAIEELVAVHVMRMTLGRPEFQSLGALGRALEAAGFQDVEARRIDRGYLHPHMVVRARKP